MDCNAPNLTAIFDKNESYLLIGVQGSLKQGKFIFLCDTMQCLPIIAGVSFKAAELFCIFGPNCFLFSVSPFTTICNSHYCLQYNSYHVSLENLQLDQPIIPSFIFFFILLTCLLEFIVIL